MVHHPGRAGVGAFKQPREAGAGEVQGCLVRIRALYRCGVARRCAGQWGMQGLSAQKTRSLLHSHLYSTTAPVALGSLQDSSDWDEPTVTHPDQSLALLGASEPELVQSPPLHPCARAYPYLRLLLCQYSGKSTAAAARGVLPEQAQG